MLNRYVDLEEREECRLKVRGEFCRLLAARPGSFPREPEISQLAARALGLVSLDFGTPLREHLVSQYHSFLEVSYVHGPPDPSAALSRSLVLIPGDILEGSSDLGVREEFEDWDRRIREGLGIPADGISSSPTPEAPSCSAPTRYERVVE